MTIHIDNLAFNTIIGLLDFERDKPQKVIVDLKAYYAYEDEFIDYAQLVEIIKSHLKSKRYVLLEDALLGLKDQIISTYPQISELWLKIAKPDIIEGCSVALSNSWKVNS